MSRRAQRSVSVMMALLFAIMSFASVGAYHEDEEVQHEFADSRFENRWARTDYPVKQGATVRTWIWGPSPFTEGRMEPYLQSPGGERLVQYFDKSRMELNNPESDDTSIWTVTQGLLALDMLLGQVQVGDASFVNHSEGASMKNVAGDPGPNNGPTYATMAGLMGADARAEGAYIVDWLAADGTITTDNELANYDVTAYYNVQVDWIDHTVASPFWEFMNSEGMVWDGDYSEDKLFQDPFYAVGYPVTEAYWTNVKVAGVDNDVLVQCFERRCLTYTPGNPEGWMVEAGNVGQHYYRWLETHVGSVVPVELLAEGLVQPRHALYTGDGVYVAEAGDGGDVCVMIEDEYDDEIVEFEVCAGLSGGITLIDDEGATRVVDGLPSLWLGEDGVGAHDVAFDDEGNMYVVMGFGGPPEARDLFEDFGEYFATVVRIEEDGTPTIIADLGEYEATENPDGEDLDTNPYAIDFDGESLVVIDAGGNTLLRVDPDDGSIELIAVFPQGEALAPPFIGLPDGATIPMDSVPTDVVVGPDGNYYVGELTGFPFPVGGANVYQVTPDGEISVYEDGFTNIGAIAFDSQGRLVVLEMVAGGLLGIDFEAVEEGDLSTAAGQVVRIEADGSRTILEVPGLIFGTGLALGQVDEMYLVHLSITPMAQVVQFY
ncbi:MAG: ScyD/ScyE family protein [Sphaerobacteraceae bacterium]|nr:MAG: ScyD/ScyE family protein [Sphaerobacteraceae bacterium]